MIQSLACGVYSPKSIALMSRYAVRNAHNGRFMRSVAPKPTETPKQDDKPNQGQPKPSPANVAKLIAIVSILSLAVYNIIYVRFFYL